MKKIIAIILSAAAVLSFTGCSSSQQPDISSQQPDTSLQQQNESLQQTDTSSQQFNISIAQFAEHGSLDNCRNGFIEGLEEEGFVEGENITISYQNAQADLGVTNQIAQNFVSNKSDLICAIATPMAQACYIAAEETDIPVIYTAVTDPIAAQLAGEDGLSPKNATGTSDKLPIDEQLKMIREFMPEAKKIGILYSTSETNSESAIAEYKEKAGYYGFEIVESGINQSADIPMAAADIVTKVDCITNLTDNTVVNSLAVVLDAANSASIPVFGSEIEQVKNGCVAAAGLDYVELGKLTGKMAAAVLKGESKPSAMEYEIISESEIYINSEALSQLNIAIPDSISDKAIEANNSDNE